MFDLLHVDLPIIDVQCTFSQIVRKRSPRMSLASGLEIRQSFRQTPDSVRNSFMQLSAGAQGQNGTPQGEKDHIFR